MKKFLDKVLNSDFGFWMFVSGIIELLITLPFLIFFYFIQSDSDVVYKGLMELVFLFLILILLTIFPIAILALELPVERLQQIIKSNIFSYIVYIIGILTYLLILSYCIVIVFIVIIQHIVL